MRIWINKDFLDLRTFIIKIRGLSDCLSVTDSLHSSYKTTLHVEVIGNTHRKRLNYWLIDIELATCVHLMKICNFKENNSGIFISSKSYCVEKSILVYLNHRLLTGTYMSIFYIVCHDYFYEFFIMFPFNKIKWV